MAGWPRHWNARRGTGPGGQSSGAPARTPREELERCRMASARAAAMPPPGLSGSVTSVWWRSECPGGMTADLRSLIGDIRGKLGSEPAVKWR